METPQLIKMRNFIHSIQHKNLNDGKIRPLTIYIMLDNSYTIDESQNAVIWDDANEQFISFGINSQIQNPSIGMSKPIDIGEAVFVDYGEIQQLRVSIGEIDFDNMCDKLGVLITPAVRENIRFKLYKATDPSYYINKELKTHY